MTASPSRPADRTQLDYGFLRTPPWIFGLVLCVLFAFACHYLAQWQWDRRIQVMHQVNRVLENYDDEPVPYVEASDVFTDFDPEREWTPVRLTGEYLVDETLVVRNRPRAGRPGYEVLVPFRTQEGDVVVVDRGWLQVGNTQGRPDAVPAPPEGEVSVVVRAKPGEPALDREAPEGQIPSIDLAAVEREVGEPVADTAYGIMVSEDPPVESMPQKLVEPTLDEGPHLSYAIQWYLFALMGFGVWAYSARQRARNDRADALEDAAAGLAPQERDPSRRRRRVRPARARRDGRLTDEEAEDALFD